MLNASPILSTNATFFGSRSEKYHITFICNNNWKAPKMKRDRLSNNNRLPQRVKIQMNAIFFRVRSETFNTTFICNVNWKVRRVELERLVNDNQRVLQRVKVLMRTYQGMEKHALQLWSTNAVFFSIRRYTFQRPLIWNVNWNVRRIEIIRKAYNIIV